MRIDRILNISAIRTRFSVIATYAATVAFLPLASLAAPSHGIAMYGEPALPAGFAHLPYANPNAPKGGAIRLAEPGGFDSLKPWVLKGTAAWPVSLHIGETLMYRSIDEPFTLYGLLAESVETAPDRSWVEFTLRPEARFSDGSPVTIEDVLWSFDTMGTQGHPRYRGTWSKVEKMEQTGPRTVRFTFNEADRELAMLMGMRPILKKAQWDGQDFSDSGLEIPIASGPYVIDKVDPNRSLTFRLNPDYWGRDLPVNRGLHNIETIRYDFYGDVSAMFEAFRAGETDVWREYNGAKWQTQFSFPRVNSGQVVKAEIPNARPSGIMGLVMNTRHPIFADWRVRQAMIEAFNFQFINTTLTGGADARITSYFANSELAMEPGPATGLQADFLAPFAADLLPGTLDGYTLPDGAPGVIDRPALRRATALLRDAGWQVQDGVLRDATGRPFAFEILLNQSGTALRSAAETQQIADIYIESLKVLGMRPRLTLLDSAQFIQRTNNYDFDMTWYERSLSLSPGNEQLLYWGHDGVDKPGTRNWMGMNSPAAEAMIRHMVNATTTEQFTAATRALDRVLTAGRYVIPVNFAPVGRVAHSARLQYPAYIPIYGDWPGFLPDTWWIDGTAANSP